MKNALHRCMVSAAQGGVTTSPLVRAARVHGVGVLIPLYVGAMLLSLIIFGAFAPESAGGAAVQRVVVTTLWAGVGCVFVFAGTPLAHQFATWGVGLLGAVSAFLAALWDFAAATMLGNSYAALGVFDLVISGSFAAATIIAARTMAELGEVGTGSPANIPAGGAFGFGAAPVAPAAATPVVGAVETDVAAEQVNPAQRPTDTASSVPSSPIGAQDGLLSHPAGYPPVNGGLGPRQNALATPALVLGVLFPPVGIVLGHVSLSQIKRSGEEGRSLATAGLVIGYVFTGIALASWIAIIAFTASLSNSIDQSLSQISTPETTYDYPTTTVDTTTTDSTPASISDVIRTASVGTCLHKESSGTTITELYSTTCSSYDANYQVSARVFDTSACGADSNWVSTTMDDVTSALVVLCLTSE